MSFSLPNPTTPTNGQPGNATPILQNEQAIAQAIATFKADLASKYADLKVVEAQAETGFSDLLK